MTGELCAVTIPAAVVASSAIVTCGLRSAVQGLVLTLRTGAAAGYTATLSASLRPPKTSEADTAQAVAAEVQEPAEPAPLASVANRATA